MRYMRLMGWGAAVAFGLMVTGCGTKTIVVHEAATTVSTTTTTIPPTTTVDVRSAGVAPTAVQVLQMFSDSADKLIEACTVGSGEQCGLALSLGNDVVTVNLQTMHKILDDRLSGEALPDDLASTPRLVAALEAATAKARRCDQIGSVELACRDRIDGEVSALQALANLGDAWKSYT